MGSETSILLMLALTLCVTLLGPGLISIEDTRRAEPHPDEANDSTRSE